jgi:hypothetical protein
VLPPAGTASPPDLIWNHRAIEWVAAVETTAKDPYVAITGNFDGNGVSLGLLQWNFGQGTLQKLLQGITDETVSSLMPKFGTL